MTRTASQKRRRAQARNAVGNRITSRAQQRPIQASKTVTARTPSSVIGNLGAPRARSSVANNYMLSRLNPFESRGSVTIPDGQNTNFLSTDMMLNDTIVPGGTGFVIQTLPCLPAAAMIAPLTGSTLTVNGVAVTAPSSLSLTDAVGFGCYPLSVPPQYKIGAGFSPGVAQDDIYYATKARAVAYGYRLIYTGPAQTCAGAIVVTPNDVSFSELGNTTDNTGAAGKISLAISRPDNLATGVTSAPIGCPILLTDLRLSSTAITRDSMTFRPEQGVVIVPRHHSSNYGIKPVVDVPFGVVAESALTTSSYTMLMQDRQTGPGYCGGIIFYDNDWESFQISVTGINSDATYRWETVILMEYGPSLSSAFQPFTQKTSTEDKALMSNTNAVLDRAPAVTTLNQPSDGMDKIIAILREKQNTTAVRERRLGT